MFSYNDIIGHFYNVVYIIGFLIKDIIWLRVVMIIGAIFEMLYFILIGYEELAVGLFWCLVWIAVNAVQLYLLLNEKINLKFNEKELNIYNHSFKILSKINFRKLLDIAEWEFIDKNTTLIEESKDLDKLIFITKGIAKVDLPENNTAFLTDGNFIGEMSFITKELTTAKVSTVTPVEFIVWKRDKLNNLFQKYKEIEEGVSTIFNHDLVKKLSKMRIKKLDLDKDIS